MKPARKQEPQNNTPLNKVKAQANVSSVQPSELKSTVRSLASSSNVIAPSSGENQKSKPTEEKSPQPAAVKANNTSANREPNLVQIETRATNKVAKVESKAKEKPTNELMPPPITPKVNEGSSTTQETVKPKSSSNEEKSSAQPSVKIAAEKPDKEAEESSSP